MTSTSSIKKKKVKKDLIVIEEDQLTFLKRQFPREVKETTAQYHDVGECRWRINFWGSKLVNNKIQNVIVRSLYVILHNRDKQWEIKKIIGDM